ncbi:hypothetical protein BGX38DRAFT_39305 [Terfezia claveryi]|nr:hypothetical protein BGX38DRAFT_39305 [Terfezia claveryi]
MQELTPPAWVVLSLYWLVTILIDLILTDPNPSSPGSLSLPLVLGLKRKLHYPPRMSPSSSVSPPTAPFSTSAAPTSSSSPPRT